jgi:hypothetical protein
MTRPERRATNPRDLAEEAKETYMTRPERRATNPRDLAEEAPRGKARIIARFLRVVFGEDVLDGVALPELLVVCVEPQGGEYDVVKERHELLLEHLRGV